MKTNLNLLKLFTLASTFTFSGGLATVPMLHEKLVEENNYITSDEFYHYVTLGQTIPGVQVLSTACLLGYKINGRLGKLFASIGAIAPVLVIMTILTIFYQFLPSDGVLLYIMSGLRASAGIYILEAVLGMYPHIVKGSIRIHIVVISIAVILTLLPIPSIYVLLLFIGLAVLSVATNKEFL